MVLPDRTSRYTPLSKTSSRANGSLAVLDIGSTKFCCLIARVSGRDIEITGMGHHAAAGVKAGTLIDMEAASAAIAKTIQAAERRANCTLEKLLVNVNGPTLKSGVITLAAPLNGAEITPQTLRRLLGRAPHAAAGPGRTVAHTLPAAWRLDGVGGIADPRGMAGDEMQVDIQVISANAGAVRNLETCLSRLHVSIENVCASGLASALAVLDDDERNLGVTLIDMGGGTTNIVVFRDGHPIFVHCLPVGGQHVTHDIAHGLSTPIAAAERLKVIHGNALSTALDDSDLIEVKSMGDEPVHSQPIPRSLLNGIIRPRVEEIFDLVRASLADVGLLQSSGRRMVLTGGAAQLPGVLEIGQAILDKQASLGRPGRFSPLPRDLTSPDFATAAGLMMYALGQDSARTASLAPSTRGTGLISKVSQWVQAHF